MKTFEYRGFDRDGRVRHGLIEALGPKDAREKLAADGILAERLLATGRRVQFPVELRATVYRELSALISAGMPLVKALDQLIQSPEKLELRTLLAGVRDRVREGASLAAALAEASDSVTPFERAIVQAAERSATVDVMLDRVASFLEEQQTLRERVQSALVYPAIVVTVGVCVAVLMLGLLVPRAKSLLAGSGAPLPALTAGMIAIGQFFAQWGVVLLLGAAVAAVWMRRRWRQNEDVRLRWSRRVFRVPLWGPGYTLLVNVRFARTLAILLAGGVPLIEALALSGRATGNGWLAAQADEQAQTVRHGSSLSDAVRRIPPLAGTLPGWIQVGEAGGGLARLLEGAGQRYQDQWQRFVTRRLALLEPLLILVIGVFVLLVALSVLLPVLSLSQAVGR
jgi:general secretion pathway protein F